jgi:hypothetical protein
MVVKSKVLPVNIKHTPRERYPETMDTNERPGFFAYAGQDTIVYKGLYGVSKQGARPCIACTAKLLIPKGTLVYLTRTKCRAKFVKVLEITKVHSAVRFTHAFGTYLSSFRYVVHQKAIPDRFSLRHKMCSNGIHFFRTLDEARNYIS